MPETIMSRSPLIEAGTSQTGNLLQFLAWLSERPRSYADTMEAWKTSCPGCPPGKTRRPTAWSTPPTVPPAPDPSSC